MPSWKKNIFVNAIKSRMTQEERTAEPENEKIKQLEQQIALQDGAIMELAELLGGLLVWLNFM